MGIIAIPKPSMALNTWNMTGLGFPQYKMYNTWYLDENETVEHIAGWVAKVASGAPGGRLKCVVLNSHGSQGRASLSKRASLDSSTAKSFAPLKGLVSHFIITACDVIGIPPGQTDGFWNDSGVKLVYALAQATGARVYASNEDQSEDITYVLFGGQGDIDDFEGSILMMPPSGLGAWLSSNGELALMLHNL